MHELKVTPAAGDAPVEKRVWQTPMMEVFDVQTLTTNGPPPLYNPADITGYQS